MKPFEQMYKFSEFHSSVLTDAELEARPMVLLLGQYSTGKTTFIRYLVGKDVPGQHIGPEPTTDRFVAVMNGPDERVVPGNAACVQTDKPFQGLSKFGTAFLSKFQISQLPSPLLERISLIDTPGVLSGEKQRIGRTYDFTQITSWFAERCDMILLLFDAHKLDISDEFKRAIEALKGHDDKIRVVLNKSDMVSAQQLMRVYGALMWALGKVVKTPEVVRVYLGSFWDQPLQNPETKALLESEMKDLLSDLRALPRNAAIRKINELIKRARLAKVHAHLISHLRSEMPFMFGKDSKQKELIDKLDDVYRKVQHQYQLPMGDFPDIDQFRERLRLNDLSTFPKLDPAQMAMFESALSQDIPRLMQKFPVTGAVPKLPGTQQNPFSPDADADPTEASDWDWAVVVASRPEYTSQFNALSTSGPTGKISGKAIRPTLLQSNLPNELLAKLWSLADIDRDGSLDLDEFSLIMHLIKLVQRGAPVPDTLPGTLVPPSKRTVLG
eukprot:TRINITY_DN2462_c0_g1_i1.p1 TRINITY_DN2462_c0_g1~~TRINITY_DN2462_c0_g1_i1.p1  ORF type:complete len:498 (+),score=100.06 TRINITY_DN2462_c0_g1_i1:154-1647(+)